MACLATSGTLAKTSIKTSWCLAVLSAILFSDSSESSSKKKEYVSCADDCVIDLDFCKISSVIYDKNRNGYISEVNFDNCKNELESCISDC